MDPPPWLDGEPRQRFLRFAAALARRGDLEETDRTLILTAALIASELETRPPTSVERLLALAQEMRHQYAALGLRTEPSPGGEE